MSSIPGSPQSPHSSQSQRSQRSQHSQRSQRSSNSLFGSDFSEGETRALDEAYRIIRAYRNQMHHDDKENKSPSLSPITRRVIQPKKTIQKKIIKNKEKILLNMRGGNKSPSSSPIRRVIPAKKTIKKKKTKNKK